MAGAMIIDLGKSALKRAAKRVAAALSWQGWNDSPEGELHPKGPDGRWVEGHPFTGIIGDAPDHIHHMHDKDLASSHASAKSLLVAIEAEQGRRNPGDLRNAGVEYTPDRPAVKRISEAERRQHALNRGRTIEQDMANPAKPLRASRKPKVDIESIRGEWESAAARPMPSDRERLKEKLSGLTIKQLEELAGERLTQGNKQQKITELVERKIGYRLNSEAIRHGHSMGVGRTDRDVQLERINTSMYEADARGDRAEYGRLHEERLDLDRRLQNEAMEPARGRPARGDRPVQQSSVWEGSVSPTKVGADKTEITPESMANVRGQRRAQTKVDRIKSKLADVRAESRDRGDRLQSEQEIELANDLRKAEDELREAKRKAGTLPDVRGNAGSSMTGGSGSFDITDAGQREARIKELTRKINAEPNDDLRATYSKERAQLATWKPEGSRSRPKEPFMYAGESPQRGQERHHTASEVERPGIERDTARAQEVKEKVRRNTEPDEIAQILSDAKLNPRQLRMVADELGVNLGVPPGGYGRAPRTKADKIRLIADEIGLGNRRRSGGIR